MNTLATPRARAAVVSPLLLIFLVACSSPQRAKATLTAIPELAYTASPTAAVVPMAKPVPTPTPTLIRIQLSESTPYWPTDGWRTSTPEQQGMDSERLAQMFEFIQNEDANLHSVLIVRNGYIVAEAYFYPFQQDTRHEIRDCTKNVTAALVGIAIGEGHIDRVDRPMLDFFSERPIANPDPRKEDITIENLLTMTSSLDWLELNHLYRYPTNSATQMMQSQDWVQFVLDRPMVAEPGGIIAAYLLPGEVRSRMNSGCSHLLSAIVQKVTGMSAAFFAQTRLFEPLGISDVSWPSDPNGISIGGTGIRMTPRDMAKFGYLFLKGGVWEMQQVVPADWVQVSFEKHGVVGEHFLEYYGYGWWIHVFDAYSATGYGGQYIFVIPNQDVVAVFTGGLKWNDYLPMRLVEFFVIPAARASEPLPDNPQGVQTLNSRIQAVEQPTPQLVSPLPSIVQSISGKTYSLDANALGWKSFSLSFQDTNALLNLSVESERLELPIGLDGVYRISDAEQPHVALKGFWQDDQTFEVYQQVLGEADRVNLTFFFDGDTVTVSMRGFIEGDFKEFGGRLQE